MRKKINPHYRAWQDRAIDYAPDQKVESIDGYRLVIARVNRDLSVSAVYKRIR